MIRVGEPEGVLTRQLAHNAILQISETTDISTVCLNAVF